MQTEKDLRLPTEFTVRQLERMAELVMRENSQKPNPEDHNLGCKLDEYCSLAHRTHGFRRAG